MSRSKRLSGVADAAPVSISHLDGGESIVQFQLIQPFIFLLLVPDVLSNQFLVAPYCGHEVSSRPEMLSDKVLLPFSVHPRQMNSALPFDVSTTCDTEYFGGMEIIMCT